MTVPFSVDAFAYTDYNRKQCVCDLDIYNGSLVVVTERADNPGMSITNAAEIVATEIVSAARDLGVDATKWLYVEHYPVSEYHDDDTYDIVEFTWINGRASRPTWRHLPRKKFAELINIT